MGHGFLSESNLTTRVKEARRAVGDDGSRQQVIRNVRGRGYRFVASVEAVGARRSTAARGILLGRDAEVAETIELLEHAALVTLTGPGGVGKSTVATAIASQAGMSRVGGIRANASSLSHAELDEALELDRGDADDLAARYLELRALLPSLQVVGGCCGTDHHHVEAIARAVCAR